MKVGLISDIHANRVALEAVLDDMPPVDLILCAGDLVGYNPWPAAVIETIREQEIPCVQGNHDRMVASGRNFPGNEMARAGVRLAREQLSADQIAFLDGLPTERHVFDGRVKVVHGHPADPDHYTYPEEFGPDLLGEESVLVLGHTHVQHVAETSEGVIVNPGSVGQPRDRDPRAAYAVLDLDAVAVETSRVSYDIPQVEQAVIEAGLPRSTATRLRDGR
ncbi:serine/threonine protein phosphatase [Halodesulfurarchaeum formicicum]|uniref:Phosphoesterase n=1 Tax=Halodesulfurarchaeum formicicum TaxID=1873524 RepID=A0A1D8S1I3_9EURY|nr:metallophosphoesterase family protein [Halodesulfurarchaeum formicicum]AOW79224.1 serine/threonine protein phosphatase [Halodesulfurarchaeum formicicum]